MIMVSKRQGGRPIAEIRDENDAIFRNDLDRLNVLRPTAYPFATDHIPEIIEATAKLIERGYAYHVDGDVFFEAEKFERYGNSTVSRTKRWENWKTPNRNERRRSAAT